MQTDVWGVMIVLHCHVKSENAKQLFHTLWGSGVEKRRKYDKKTVCAKWTLDAKKTQDNFYNVVSIIHFCITRKDG